MNKSEQFYFELGFHHAREEAARITERKAQGCSDSCLNEVTVSIRSLPLPEGM